MKFKCYLKKIIRQGFTFNKLYAQLVESQYFSPEELERTQNKKLQKLIKHCYKNVPYYKELFDSLGLKPEDIQTRADLAKLPYLDKYIVKANPENFVAKNTCKKLCNIGQTSGTTGTPLSLYRDYHSINFENAAVQRHYANVSAIGAKKITLRGQLVVPVEQKEAPFWEFNPADNELIMSSYHLSDTNAKSFVDKVFEFKPEVICAYPSAIYLLAKYFENLNKKFKLNAIFTSSEQLEDYKRELIEKIFECKVYDWYGQAERVVAIGQCEKGSYHLIEDYSIVETIEAKEGAELVGTALDNYAMPLLRYKTGDIVQFSAESCACCRCFQVIGKLQGRQTSYYFMTNDGVKITAFDHFVRGVENIFEAQVVQEKIGELIINVVANEKFGDKDKNLLVKNVLEHTSSDMKVVINKVSQIPRGANGKFTNVINKLARV